MEAAKATAEGDFAKAKQKFQASTSDQGNLELLAKVSRPILLPREVHRAKGTPA
jgi:hypothetical protein